MYNNTIGAIRKDFHMRILYNLIMFKERPVMNYLT